MWGCAVRVRGVQRSPRACIVPRAGRRGAGRAAVRGEGRVSRAGPPATAGPPRPRRARRRPSAGRTRGSPSGSGRRAGGCGRPVLSGPGRRGAGARLIRTGSRPQGATYARSSVIRRSGPPPGAGPRPGRTRTSHRPAPRGRRRQTSPGRERRPPRTPPSPPAPRWPPAVRPLRGGIMPANQSRSLGAVRSESRGRHQPDDPVGQPGTAGRRVRTAAGVAEDGEAVDAQRVGGRPHVGCGRRGVPAGEGEEPPWPGWSYDPQRMPDSAAAAKSGAGGEPMFGVPWCRRTTSPSPPVSYTWSPRPSDGRRSLSLTLTPPPSTAWDAPAARNCRPTPREGHTSLLPQRQPTGSPPRLDLRERVRPGTDHRNGRAHDQD